VHISQVSTGLAFLAGLASFLSPCVFSLVPAYIGYLGGRTLSAHSSSRWLTFSHGLAFVVGFSAVFISLGVAASAAGRLLFDLRFWLSKVGGIVVIIFGLQMIGLIRLPFLAMDTRVNQAPDRRSGYLASTLMGVFFSAGWSPCVGPVLGTILTFAVNGGSVSQGARLLATYSAGLAIPFLLAALSIDWVTTVVRRYGRVMHYVEIAMGLILVAVGIMLFAGTFELLARYGYFVDFGL